MASMQICIATQIMSNPVYSYTIVLKHLYLHVSGQNYRILGTVEGLGK